MNLIDLEAFVAVVNHGSIVAASAILHLTQSAVTRRIQSLEDALGQPLLDRQTRPMQPTRAGQRTYEFAKPVLSSVNDLKTGMIDGADPSGEFRFGMARGLGDLAIGSPIRCLRAEFPKVRVQAYVQWVGILLERLANRTLDAAVVLLPDGDLPPATLSSECLGSEPLSVIASRDVRFGNPATLAELSAYPWVLNPHGCGGRRLIESALLQKGLPFLTTVEAEGFELHFSLIAEGVGLGLARPQLFHASPARGQMKLVKVKDFTPAQNVWLLHSGHLGRLTPILACVREAVLQDLRIGRAPKRGPNK